MSSSASGISNDNNETYKENQPIHIVTTISIPTSLGGNLYSILAYPFYRKFLEMKFFGLQKISNKFYFPNKKEIKFSIKSRNGYYAGLTSHILAQFTQIEYPEMEENQSFMLFYRFLPNLVFKNNREMQEFGTQIIFRSVFLFFSYPLLYNSNNKAFNLDLFKKLRNPKNLFLLYKNYYSRGSFIYIVNGLIGNIPLLNLFLCHKIESIRIAYVYGINYDGKLFFNYKEAHKFIKENDTINKGRGLYNLIFVPYYINFLSELIETAEEDDG